MQFIILSVARMSDIWNIPGHFHSAFNFAPIHLPVKLQCGFMSSVACFLAVIVMIHCFIVITFLLACLLAG